MLHGPGDWFLGPIKVAQSQDGRTQVAQDDDTNIGLEIFKIQLQIRVTNKNLKGKTDLI